VENDLDDDRGVETGCFGVLFYDTLLRLMPGVVDARVSWAFWCSGVLDNL